LCVCVCVRACVCVCVCVCADRIVGLTQLVNTMSGVEKFTSSLRGGSEPSKPVTLFAFDEYFPAVATTDLLARVSDVLACKPSELAFYPLPKLMLR
jgi:hypothetical protein